MAKILLVEDNELNRDMLSRRLKRRGYAVAIARDGLEGLAQATSEQPDLILMDMSLPQLDGWEATRRLKADDQTCSIPIIALTAHAALAPWVVHAAILKRSIFENSYCHWPEELDSYPDEDTAFWFSV
ncbi:MAG: response regulator, partial [Cyanothece sp. SIO1E1]|nr:response regulator [Cyanothece sp. SIO1E1]